ncbi:gas vesicle protein [Actinomycetospora callitridis]|uniref:gas vesicle protein n=1 Tax=Actinomycetospora callitridis TaxID=913944 RepID=UPI002366C221|nr:gas vesicle protein [Actinomycetospora callitridis]MDD7920547.1 gas vesicle protein [Actinomycetospora callitridis]
MSDPVRWTGQMPSAPNQAGGRQPAAQGGGGDGTNLADILERVLDKGIVIAGDVQINLLDIELLTIKLRLIVASVDRAKEMGIDWWERDPTLSSGHSELEQENRRLRERLEALEGRNGQAALEGDDDPDEVEVEDEDAELVDAEIVDDTEEPEPQPARRPKQTAQQGGGGKAAPRRRRKAEE